MADVLAVRDEYRAQTWAVLIQKCNTNGLTKREFSSSVRSQRRVSTIGFGNFTVRWSRPLRRSWNRLPSRMICFRFSIAERNCSCPAMCIWIPLRHCCGRYNRYDRSEQNMQLQRSLRIYRSTSGHRWFCCRCDAAVCRSSGWNFCF